MKFRRSYEMFLYKIRKTPIYIVIIFLIFMLIEYFGLHLHLFEVDYGRFSYPLDVPIKEYILAIKTGKEPPHKPINKYNHIFTLKNERKCKELDSEEYENVVILYVVKSAMDHQNRRNIIRETWGWEKRFSDVPIRKVFMVGTSDDSIVQAKILEEYALYKDMVQADFVDSYYNNTIKTMMSFRWVIENCPKAQFIVFSDDDMYVSTKNLLKFIRNPFNNRVGFRKRREIETFENKQNEHAGEMSNKTKTKDINVLSRKLSFDPVLSAFDGRLFAGFVFNSSPMRHKSSKWFITLDEYPFSRYPPYVTAGAYVLSYPALEDMYYTSLYTKHFKFDDIYLGIIAKKCYISPLHNEHFHYWKKTYSKEAYANVIASHGYDDPDELKKVWDEQRSLGHA